MFKGFLIISQTRVQQKFGKVALIYLARTRQFKRFKFDGNRPICWWHFLYVPLKKDDNKLTTNYLKDRLELFGNTEDIC